MKKKERSLGKKVYMASQKSLNTLDPVQSHVTELSLKNETYSSCPVLMRS